MMVQFQNCANVLIEGVTLRDAPCWTLHPVLCRDVIVRDVRVFGHGPNTDGCDPESVESMLIERCAFDCGDDCIAIKSGRNADGRRLARPTRDILIQDCVMKDGHGGVVIGSSGRKTSRVRDGFCRCRPILVNFGNFGVRAETYVADALAFSGLMC